MGWGRNNVVTVRDTASSPVAAYLCKSTATADAQLMFGSTGVVLGDGIKEGTGMTEAKGLEIVGDDAFTAGSDLIVTITGFIGNVPA